MRGKKKERGKYWRVTMRGEGPPSPPAGAVGTGGWVENGTVKDREIR